MHLTAYDLLVSTNRETRGGNYRRLRSPGTSLRHADYYEYKDEREVLEGFGLVDGWRIRPQDRKRADWTQHPRYHSQTGCITQCWE